MPVAGIKYEKNVHGTPTHVRINLKKFGNNELLEDFLDGLEVEKVRGGETITLEELIVKQNKKRHIK
jgi:hypothetical protein